MFRDSSIAARPSSVNSRLFRSSLQIWLSIIELRLKNSSSGTTPFCQSLSSSPAAADSLLIFAAVGSIALCTLSNACRCRLISSRSRFACSRATCSSLTKSFTPCAASSFARLNCFNDFTAKVTCDTSTPSDKPAYCSAIGFSSVYEKSARRRFVICCASFRVLFAP